MPIIIIFFFNICRVLSNVSVTLQIIQLHINLCVGFGNNQIPGILCSLSQLQCGISSQLSVVVIYKIQQR